MLLPGFLCPAITELNNFFTQLFQGIGGLIVVGKKRLVIDLAEAVESGGRGRAAWRNESVIGTTNDWGKN